MKNIFLWTSGSQTTRLNVFFFILFRLYLHENTWKRAARVGHENNNTKKKLSHLNTMYDWCVYNRVAWLTDAFVYYKDYVFKARCQLSGVYTGHYKGFQTRQPRRIVLIYIYFSSFLRPLRASIPYPVTTPLSQKGVRRRGPRGPGALHHRHRGAAIGIL